MFDKFKYLIEKKNIKLKIYVNFSKQIGVGKALNLL